jgi:hypothetical protein
MIERDVTRERFLAAIAEKVDPDAIAEAHLFQPMKQGGAESGVAVVAVDEGPHVTGDDAGDNDAAAMVEDAAAMPSDNRLAVYTARYRLTLKGPERGKWDFAMHVEADAPLGAVDKVVHGVQRRSGDAEDPVKISGDEFRQMLPTNAAEAPNS